MALKLFIRHIGMELQLNNSDQLNTIRSCTLCDQRYMIKIGETVYKESLILTPEKLEMWTVSQVSDLSNHDFVRISNLDAEVFILGTGVNMKFPDVAVTQPLMMKGMGIEVMSTAAACRTYNALLSDGRRVAAGLIA